MSQLFGFSLERAKKVPKGPSFVQKDNLDGSQPIVGGGYYGYSVDLYAVCFKNMGSHGVNLIILFLIAS